MASRVQARSTAAIWSGLRSSTVLGCQQPVRTTRTPSSVTGSLPATAQNGRPSWAGDLNVTQLVASHDVDDLLVVTYRVRTRPPM
jgi:hypothetical protein